MVLLLRVDGVLLAQLLVVLEVGLVLARGLLLLRLAGGRGLAATLLVPALLLGQTPPAGETKEQKAAQEGGNEEGRGQHGSLPTTTRSARVVPSTSIRR